jgi:hypothetical protein
MEFLLEVNFTEQKFFLVFIVPVGSILIQKTQKPSNNQHYIFIYLFIKMERLVSAVFGHPQAQSKKLVCTKTPHKDKKTKAFILTVLGITYLCCCII